MDRHKEGQKEEEEGDLLELRETFDVGCLGREGRFPDKEAPDLRHF